MFELSVIISHYNTPGLLEKLLGSIPVRDDVQVIVVDDNSTKDVQVLERVIAEDGRCEFYKNHTGKNSAGTCRNIGLKYAKGRWVLIADSDDYFTEGFYDTVSEYFDSDYDVVYFSPVSIDLETGGISTRHLYYEKYVKAYLKSRNQKNELELKFGFDSPWSKLISLKLINAHNIHFEDISVANDNMFSTMIACFAKRITASDRVIYTVTMSKGTLTTTVNETNLYIRLDAYIRRYLFTKANLSRKEFKCLDMAGGTFFYNALKQKAPLRVLLNIFIRLRKNKVRFFRRRWFSPAHIAGELKIRQISRKNKKKYDEFGD